MRWLETIRHIKKHGHYPDWEVNEGLKFCWRCIKPGNSGRARLTWPPVRRTVHA